MSLPTSVLRRNSIPMPVKTSRRWLSTVFSSLNSGIPKVSRPPISGFLSNTTHQHVGAAKTRRPRTDDRHTLAGRNDLGHVRTPAHGERRVGDVLLNRTNGHGTKTVVEGAGTFTQTILRAYASADFRQGVGLVRQFGGGEDVALGHQFQPVGNEVVHRALPLAIRVTATQAAVGLVGRLLGFEGFVDLHELFLALTQQFLLRIFAPDIDELEVIT